MGFDSNDNDRRRYKNNSAIGVVALQSSKNEQTEAIMNFVLIRHEVADFAKWKPVYDAHLPARQKAGLKEEHLFRNADAPNEVLLLF